MSMDSMDGLRERRHPLSSGDVIAWYEVAGFSHPDRLDEIVGSMVELVATQEPALTQEAMAAAQGQPAEVVQDDDNVQAVEDAAAAESWRLLDGVQVQFGWSLLTLRASDEGIVLCEPDFGAQAPFDSPREQVTVTAQLTAMQMHLNKRADLASSPCLCYETIMVLDGVLEVPEVLLVHGDRNSESHSGWMMMPRSKEVADALRAEGATGYYEMYAYELVACRPHLLKALALPPGSIVGFNGDAIEFVRDEENHDRLPPSEDADEPTWVEIEEAAEDEPPQDDALTADVPLPVEAAPTQGGWLGRLFKR